MIMRLEHANITVADIDSTASFFQAAFPDFQIRGKSKRGDSKWVHFGTDETYICINEAKRGTKKQKNSSLIGINHLGFEVDDAEALAERLSEAGYEESYPAESHPFRIRKYFFDTDGMEYEFVQYLSNDPDEKNDYSR